jgi:recombination protein RecT
MAIVLEAQRNPTILQCTTESIIRACYQIAVMGLDYGDGNFYLIPYLDGKKSKQLGKKVYNLQVVMGYRGLLRLATEPMPGERRWIKYIDAHVVRQGDKFELKRTQEGDVLTHIPSLVTEGGDEKIVGVYARVFFENSPTHIEYMSRIEVEKIRLMSSHGTAPESPWTQFWAEMAKKTVIRRAIKLFPKPILLSRALAIEDAQEENKDLDVEAIVEIAEKEQQENPATPQPAPAGRKNQKKDAGDGTQADALQLTLTKDEEDTVDENQPEQPVG